MKRKKNISKNAQRQIRCPHCGAIAVVRPAADIYGDPSNHGELYVCSNYPRCQSYVGIHPGTMIPMGTLANGDLRNLRIKAHRTFDRIWQNKIMSRDSAYRWMADYFGLRLQDAHIGMFGEYRCSELIKECERILAQNHRAVS
jgi:ssDNA-binding Zn-finger/Zn-ribbon topoisomerase 1